MNGEQTLDTITVGAVSYTHLDVYKRQPDDSDPEVIRKRFQVYQTKTAPIFSYYDEKHKAHKISGLGTIDDIFQHLCDTIDSLHV